MASLNAKNRDYFNRLMQDRWEREQGRKRIIEPEPEQSVGTVAAELQAPIDELPGDDPRRITFDSIKKSMDEVAGIVDVPRLAISSPDLDPPIDTKLYLDGQEVATVKRESMFGGKAIEFAEDQAVKPRLNKFLLDNFGKTFTFDAPVEQPTFQFRNFETSGWPYCKANCGARTINQSGYCFTCLDRMAVVGRVPEPKVKTPLVEMRPKRQIQLED